MAGGRAQAHGLPRLLLGCSSPAAAASAFYSLLPFIYFLAAGRVCVLEHAGQPACLYMAVWPMFKQLSPLYGLLGGTATTVAGVASRQVALSHNGGQLVKLCAM